MMQSFFPQRVMLFSLFAEGFESSTTLTIRLHSMVIYNVIPGGQVLLKCWIAQWCVNMWGEPTKFNLASRGARERIGQPHPEVMIVAIHIVSEETCKHRLCFAASSSRVCPENHMCWMGDRPSCCRNQSIELSPANGLQQPWNTTIADALARRGVHHSPCGSV